MSEFEFPENEEIVEEEEDERMEYFREVMSEEGVNMVTLSVKPELFVLEEGWKGSNSETKRAFVELVDEMKVQFDRLLVRLSLLRYKWSREGNMINSVKKLVKTADLF